MIQSTGQVQVSQRESREKAAPAPAETISPVDRCFGRQLTSNTDKPTRRTVPDTTVGHTAHGVSSKPLASRTLSTLNELAAGTAATVGLAWIRDVSLINPGNLAMSLGQHIPGLVATVLPDRPGLTSAARSAAEWGQAYGWASSFCTTLGSGNLPAAAAIAVLYGASHHIGDQVSQLCDRLPALPRTYMKPWAQVGGQFIVGGLLKTAETLGNVGNGGAGREDGRLVVPQDSISQSVTGADCPARVDGLLWQDPNLLPCACVAVNGTENAGAYPSDTITAILPANNSGYGLTCLPDDDHLPTMNPGAVGGQAGIFPPPLVEAGLIRSFTPEQIKAHLQEAARQHQALPRHCPDMASATPVGSSDHQVLCQAEGVDSGWVTAPGNLGQCFHYQLFNADPESPLMIIGPGDNAMPAPDILRQVQVRQETMAIMKVGNMPASGGHQRAATGAGDHHRSDQVNVTIATPQIQEQLNPGALSTTVKQGSVLVLKPCHPRNRTTEASTLVLSTDQGDPQVTMTVGSEGWAPAALPPRPGSTGTAGRQSGTVVPDTPRRAKRQASPSAAVPLIHELTIDPDQCPSPSALGKPTCGSSYVYSTSWSPDGDHLAVGTGSGTPKGTCPKSGSVQIWDMTREIPACLSTLNTEDWIQSVDYNTDGTRLAAGGFDGKISIYDMSADPPSLLSTLKDATIVLSVNYNADDTRLAAGGFSTSYNDRVWIYDTSADHFPLLSTLKLKANQTAPSVQSVDYNPDGTRLAAGWLNNKVQIYDTSADQPPLLSTLKEANNTVQSVDYNLDGTRLAAGGVDRRVRIYGTSSDQPSLLSTLQEANATIHSVDFNPDGTRLAAGGQDHKVRIYDTSSDQPSLLSTLQEANATIHSVDFNPDGTLLASGELSGRVRIYSTGTVDTKKRVESMQGSDARLTCNYAGRHFTVSWKKGEPTGNYENSGVVATVNRNAAASGVVPTGTDERYQITADNTLIIPAVRERDAGTYYCGVGLGNNTEIHGATELVISQRATTTDGIGKVIASGVVGSLAGSGILIGIVFYCKKLHQEGDYLTDCWQIRNTIRTGCNNLCHFFGGDVSTQRDVEQEGGNSQIAMEANTPCSVVDRVKEYETRLRNS